MGTIPAHFGRAQVRAARSILYLLISLMPLTADDSGPAQASAQGPNSLRIMIVEGGGAINNLSTRAAHDPVVRVVDASGHPVAGASVTFTAPSSGPGADFLDGNSSSTTRTGEDGRAIGRGLRPNKTAGQFTIRVAASLNGETAHASIVQTNVLPAASGSHRKKLVIAALVAGAVAGGVLAATSHGGSSPSTSGSIAPPPTISAGSPSFGPPK